MSTKNTRSPRLGLAMVDSQALRLTQAINGYQAQQVTWLIDGLALRGFAELTPSHIAFISALDCADNIASEIARRLNLSRQAIHKTVRELTNLGYVQTAKNLEKRNSKVIQITEKGEKLVAEARKMFTELDQDLQKNMDSAEIERFIQMLSESRQS